MWNSNILLCACLVCKHAALKQKDSGHHTNNKKNAVSILVIWSRWTDHKQKHPLTKIKSKCCKKSELYNVGSSWILQFCESFYLFRRPPHYLQRFMQSLVSFYSYWLFFDFHIWPFGRVHNKIHPKFAWFHIKWYKTSVFSIISTWIHKSAQSHSA